MLNRVNFYSGFYALLINWPTRIRNTLCRPVDKIDQVDRKYEIGNLLNIFNFTLDRFIIQSQTSN